MTALSIQPAYPIFTDTAGQPLDNGYIWIGTVNLAPQTNPISIYWDAALTQTFFATVQNKVHYAIHGQTAAEVITSRADRTQPNMGLTNWEGARIRKADVSIAKNYLSEPELRALGNLVEQYLIFAQSQAERRIPMTMQDWITKLEGFLRLNDREVLTNAGKVSAELAKEHAEREFTEYRRVEDHTLESDFDRAIQQLPPPPPEL
jgi:hypothetical protein